MGYNIYIKKEEVSISVKEWLDLVEKDIELEPIEIFEGNLNNGTTIVVGTPNSAIWKGIVPFVYNRGCIRVKNPDNSVLLKMLMLQKI